MCGISEDPTPRLLPGRAGLTLHRRLDPEQRGGGGDVEDVALLLAVVAGLRRQR